jgi:hypothetical protein
MTEQDLEEFEAVYPAKPYAQWSHVNQCYLTKARGIRTESTETLTDQLEVWMKAKAVYQAKTAEEADAKNKWRALTHKHEQTIINLKTEVVYLTAANPRLVELVKDMRKSKDYCRMDAWFAEIDKVLALYEKPKPMAES